MKIQTIIKLADELAKVAKEGRNAWKVLFDTLNQPEYKEFKEQIQEFFKDWYEGKEI